MPINIRGIGTVRQFEEDDFNHLEDSGCQTPYWFEKAMIEACAPLFNDVEDNHDVEDKLVKAKVINKNCVPDSECSALVVNFKTAASAKSFIRRLNKYLIKKAEAFAKAREL